MARCASLRIYPEQLPRLVIDANVASELMRPEPTPTVAAWIAAFSGFDRAASRKLDQLDAATSLSDLARPGKRLEALKGHRRGQWSIRINDQWRICFKWFEGSPGPAEVEIVDYD